jgi:hypothetical protein
MLEVRGKNGTFVLFDTDAHQPVMRFEHRRDADQLVEEMQVQELHAVLERWITDRAQGWNEQHRGTRA